MNMERRDATGYLSPRAQEPYWATPLLAGSAPRRHMTRPSRPACIVAIPQQGKVSAGPCTEALFHAILDEDIHRVVAGVTLPNDASVALHERFGFKKVGVFSANGRKFGQYWDVAWFERSLHV